MNKLEALNVVMEKQEHDMTLPMVLNIDIDGHWHAVTVDRKDKNIQKIVRVLVMMMLRNEIETTERVVKSSQKTLYNARDADNATLQDYTVRVAVGTKGPTYETIDVRAHSERDARVMASILKGEVPKDFTHILMWADQWTELV